MGLAHISCTTATRRGNSMMASISVRPKNHCAPEAVDEQMSACPRHTHLHCPAAAGAPPDLRCCMEGNQERIVQKRLSGGNVQVTGVVVEGGSAPFGCVLRGLWCPILLWFSDLSNGAPWLSLPYETVLQAFLAQQSAQNVAQRHTNTKVSRWGAHIVLFRARLGPLGAHLGISPELPWAPMVFKTAPGWTQYRFQTCKRFVFENIKD